MANNIYFDGENIQIELKDTFKVLQSLNKFNIKGAKIALRTPNLRTLEKPSIAIKKQIFYLLFVNGAHDGLLLEPLKEFLHVVKSKEYQGIEDNLFDLVA